MSVRVEESTDWTAIYAIYADAFGQLAEADLVRRLHADGDLILSLTAFTNEPVGHIAFSHPGLDATPSVRGCVLAPLAVASTHRRQGIGSVLVQESIGRLKGAGFDFAIVLGDPKYYGRFGFSADLARQVETPYDGPYVQALPLSEKGNEARGPVSYARAFAELK